ncbi:restriction endonuclease [Candidatus Entotheonella palauensis]|uniref:restriction endonuclease n=1 Tax=Candidatus Entotheonella palauensis TaxID=93172 RepID=UPI000B7F0AF7|nr:restriction endonuclease [Candidatus Entotheonella palauensis]
MKSGSTAYEWLVRPHIQSEFESLNLHDLKIQTNQRLLGVSGRTYQIDLTLEFTLAGMGFLILVECKPCQQPVGVEEVVMLHHQVMDTGAHKGILITTTGFKPAAKKYAQAHGISLVIADAHTWQVGHEHRQSHMGPSAQPIGPVVTEWNDAKNARRCQLIDKDIQGTIDDPEKHELNALTAELRTHRRRLAPRPFDKLKKLHQELLQKPPQ